jgi:hypothetical protein
MKGYPIRILELYTALLSLESMGPGDPASPLSCQPAGRETISKEIPSQEAPPFWAASFTSYQKAIMSFTHNLFNPIFQTDSKQFRTWKNLLRQQRGKGQWHARSLEVQKDRLGERNGKNR